MRTINKNDSPKPLRQPKTIKFAGRVFRLVKKWKRIGTEFPISEGPYYACDEEPDYVFSPDAGFLHVRAQDEPLFMHRMLNG